MDQDVLATDLVVEQIEAEDRLRLRFAVELVQPYENKWDMLPDLSV